MIVALQRAFLVVWRRVPRLARRWIVRFAAPSYPVGAAIVIERGAGAILLVRLAYREGWEGLGGSGWYKGWVGRAWSAQQAKRGRGRLRPPRGRRGDRRRGRAGQRPGGGRRQPAAAHRRRLPGPAGRRRRAGGGRRPL